MINSNFLMLQQVFPSLHVIIYLFCKKTVISISNDGSLCNILHCRLRPWKPCLILSVCVNRDYFPVLGCISRKFQKCSIGGMRA